MFEQIEENFYRNTLPWALGPVKIPVSTFLTKGQEGWILIDAGFDSHIDALVKDVQEQIKNEPLVTILITHGHLDHVAALPKFLELYPNCQVVLHENEGPFLMGKKYASVTGDHLVFKLSKPFLHESTVTVPKERIGYCKEGDSVGGVIQVVETPGHTPGSNSYLHIASRSLVVGDAFMNYNALFQCPGCTILRPSTFSMQKAKQSLEKMLQMDIHLYFPAHDLEKGVTKQVLEKYLKSL